MYTVYALIDPRDHSTRYVGLTNNVFHRLSQHLHSVGAKSLKSDWIKELEEEQLVVIMHSLQKAETLEEARILEEVWIKHYLKQGEKLTNIRYTNYRQHKRDPEEEYLIYQFQYRKCGKPSCRICPTSKGHGPYWYAYTRGEDGKLRSQYIGKKSPIGM